MDIQTRHALKQDALLQATRTSVDWFQENRARVIAAAIAAGVCLALLITGIAVYSNRSAAADTALGEALDTYNTALTQPGQPPTPGAKTFATAADRAKAANQQFEQVASQYSLFSAATTARYFAGLTAIDMGQNGPAESDLQKVADSHHSDIAALAKVALANLYVQTNRSSQAVVLLNQIIAKPTGTVPAEAAKLQLAAIYEKTNPAEAKKIYAQLKSDKTAAGQIATQKLQQK